MEPSTSSPSSTSSCLSLNGRMRPVWTAWSKARVHSVGSSCTVAARRASSKRLPITAALCSAVCVAPASSVTRSVISSTTLSVMPRSRIAARFQLQWPVSAAKRIRPSSNRESRNWFTKNGFPAVRSWTSSARGTASSRGTRTVSATSSLTVSRSSVVSSMRRTDDGSRAATATDSGSDGSTASGRYAPMIRRYRASGSLISVRRSRMDAASAQWRSSRNMTSGAPGRAKVRMNWRNTRLKRFCVSVGPSCATGGRGPVTSVRSGITSATTPALPARAVRISSRQAAILSGGSPSSCRTRSRRASISDA